MLKASVELLIIVIDKYLVQNVQINKFETKLYMFLDCWL